MYAEYLKLAACEIEEAADGREALAKAISRRPDVIVTETRLPGIDGFALCGLLRRDATTQRIPIVVVTADVYASDVHRAEQAGADVVLVKPCLPEKLLGEMRRVLEQSSELRARGSAVREKMAGQILRSDALIRRSHSATRQPLSKLHERHDTTSPPLAPPALICPQCDQLLAYQRSHIGGVSARHPEQWDYYECPAGCGVFQYRERTRKLRKVS
jgi:chemotaxis family two-component system response regulator PixH